MVDKRGKEAYEKANSGENQMKTRTKEEMAAYQAKRRKAKQSVAPLMSHPVTPTPPIIEDVTPEPTVIPIVTPNSNTHVTPCPMLLAMLKRINTQDDEISRLRDRMRDVIGGDVSRNQSTRPGAHPAELYGA
jgi:hypothetical protein